MFCRDRLGQITSCRKYSWRLISTDDPFQNISWIPQVKCCEPFHWLHEKSNLFSLEMIMGNVHFFIISYHLTSIITQFEQFLWFLKILKFWKVCCYWQEDLKYWVTRSVTRIDNWAARLNALAQTHAISNHYESFKKCL